MNARDHARKMLVKRNHPDLYKATAPVAAKAVKHEKVSKAKVEETVSVKEPEVPVNGSTETSVQPEVTESPVVEERPVARKRTAKKVEVAE